MSCKFCYKESANINEENCARLIKIYVVLSKIYSLEVGCHGTLTEMSFHQLRKKYLQHLNESCCEELGTIVEQINETPV